jgi:hypothetical protein
MSRLGFGTGFLALLAGCASVPNAVLPREANNGDYCVRQHVAARAYSPTDWLTCGKVKFDKVVSSRGCTPIELTTQDTFRVHEANGGVRLDIDASTRQASVSNLEMLPTMNADGAVLFYQGAANGVHYYLYQAPEPKPKEGYWYIDMFATGETNPACNAHRLSSPDQIRPGKCPARQNAAGPDAIKQGATGGGGGNKPPGIEC